MKVCCLVAYQPLNLQAQNPGMQPAPAPLCWVALPAGPAQPATRSAHPTTHTASLAQRPTRHSRAPHLCPLVGGVA